MSDLRAAVEGLPDTAFTGPEVAKHAVLALIPEGAVLVTVLPEDTVCACLDETGERKVRRYEQCQRCGAFMVADDDPEGAVLVTEEGLRPLIDDIYQRGMDAPEAAAFILRQLRETQE